MPDRFRCAICGQPITRRQADLYQTCDGWKCRAERRAQQRTARRERWERERHLRERLRQRLSALREKLAASLSIPEPDSFVPVSVPANQDSLAILPPERREAFREHLLQLIREAGQQPAAPPEDLPQDGPADADQAAMLPVVRGACAVCAGDCCRGAGDQAHLDVAVIRRYISDHPAEQPPQVLEAFLARLSERTYKGSCICHTQQGCALPREMRSGLCNSFECGALAALPGAFSGPGPHRAFVVAAVGAETFVRFRFVAPGLGPDCAGQIDPELSQ